MTAPLNGLLLNGGTPYSMWAWGWSRAEATAKAEPVIYSVHRYVDGKIIGEAASSSIADRLAFLDGKEELYAESTLVGTRHAYVEAEALGIANESITPVRKAWFKAPEVEVSALSLAYAERWKIFNAQVLATAETPYVDTQVYRQVFSRRTPGQARTWIAEARIRRIRVHQIYVKANAVARSRTRALANTELGFGKMGVGAETTADNLKVNTYHAFRGQASANCELYVDASRIRIIVGGMPCEAFVRIAPTITREGVRYSYNSGNVTAISESESRNKVLRKLYSPAYSIAASETTPVDTYLIRGMHGAQIARAEVWSIQWAFTRVRATGRLMMAKASSVSSFNRYRWSPIEALPVRAQANSFSTNRISAYSNEAVFYASATSQADYAVVRWQAGSLVSSAESSIEYTRIAHVFGKALTIADLIENAVRFAYLNGEALGTGNETSKSIRYAYLDATVDSHAAIAITADRTAWMSHASENAWAETVGNNTRFAGFDSHVSAYSEINVDALRTAYLNSQALSEASVTNDSLRYAYLHAKHEALAEAISVVERTAWMSQTIGIGEATNKGWFARIAFCENQEDTALSEVSAKAHILTLRFWGEEVLEAEAETQGVVEKIVEASPSVLDANAVSMKLKYRINSNGLAPDNRTVYLRYNERLLALASSNREYRIQ